MDSQSDRKGGDARAPSRCTSMCWSSMLCREQETTLSSASQRDARQRWTPAGSGEHCSSAARECGLCSGQLPARVPRPNKQMKQMETHRPFDERALAHEKRCIASTRGAQGMQVEGHLDDSSAAAISPLCGQMELNLAPSASHYDEDQNATTSLMHSDLR